MGHFETALVEAQAPASLAFGDVLPAGQFCWIRTSCLLSQDYNLDFSKFLKFEGAREKMSLQFALVKQMSLRTKIIFAKGLGRRVFWLFVLFASSVLCQLRHLF